VARRLINLAVGLLLGGLFLFYVFHDLDLDGLKSSFARADYLFLLPYAVSVFGYHCVRILRWHLMLQPLHRFTFGRVFQIASVGFLSILLLPFRLGELVRPYLAAERGEVRMSSALATVMVERSVDGIVLTLLFFLLTANAPFHDNPRIPVDLTTIGLVAFLLFSVLLVGLATMVLLGERAERVAGRVGRVLGERAGQRLAGLAQSFSEGLAVLRGGGRLGIFLLLTVAYWSINGLGALLLFQAMSETAELPWLASYGLMAVLGVAVMIPHLPGFVGAFQVAVFVALLMFDADISKEGATAFSFLMQGTIIAVQALCGFPFLIMGKVSLSLGRKSDEH